LAENASATLALFSTMYLEDSYFTVRTMQKSRVVDPDLDPAFFLFPDPDPKNF
jgi:hypothetical protein